MRFRNRTFLREEVFRACLQVQGIHLFLDPRLWSVWHVTFISCHDHLVKQATPLRPSSDTVKGKYVDADTQTDTQITHQLTLIQIYNSSVRLVTLWCAVGYPTEQIFGVPWVILLNKTLVCRGLSY